MSLDLSRLRTRLQQALGDKFKVGALLGEGGFAAVFRVHDKALRREVAVKVLDLGLTPSPELADRFVREARTVAQLEHEHIVPIYKVGGYRNEVLYIVMQWVDGPSLRQLLDKRGRLPIADAARITRQVAAALGYAHREGVVHRDVKPDNILLDAGGRVLVTDFGIAKAAEAASSAQLTTEGMVIGTPQYMSPEQATGDKVGTRSDIYSLGIVLYHMLAGSVPFDGDSAQSILMKQATADPAPIRGIRRDVSAELAAVLDRMLAKDPAERFSTAAHLDTALVKAVGAAPRDRLEKPPSAAMKVVATSVIGAGLAASVGLGALVAGSAVVGWVLLDRPPKIRMTAPVPDSLNAALRRRGVLAQDDTAVFAFSPGGTRSRRCSSSPSAESSWWRGITCVVIRGTAWRTPSRPAGGPARGSSSSCSRRARGQTPCSNTCRRAACGAWRVAWTDCSRGDSAQRHRTPAPSVPPSAQ